MPETEQEYMSISYWMDKLEQATTATRVYATVMRFQYVTDGAYANKNEYRRMQTAILNAAIKRAFTLGRTKGE